MIGNEDELRWGEGSWWDYPQGLVSWCAGRASTSSMWGSQTKGKTPAEVSGRLTLPSASASLLLGLQFDTEDRCDIFLRSVRFSQISLALPPTSAGLSFRSFFIPVNVCDMFVSLNYMGLKPRRPDCFVDDISTAYLRTLPKSIYINYSPTQVVC
jgi:hypothetical protein